MDSMSEKASTPEPLPPDPARDPGAASPPAVASTSEPEPVRPSVIHVLPPSVERVAPVLPLVVAGLTLGAPVVYPIDLMFFTGMLSATVASLLVVMLGPAVRRALGALWTARLLVARPPEATDAFAKFTDRFQRDLDSKAGSAIVAAAFAVFATPQFFIAEANGLSSLDNGDLGRVGAVLANWSPLRIIGVAVTALIGAALGPFAWRMAVIGAYVTQLGREFEFRLQSSHPDGAGGTQPLGALCFLNALIVSVPSIFLGVWRTLIATLPDVRARYGYLEGWFTFLLAVTVLLALVGFLLPLYSLHQAMERERDRRRPTVERMSDDLATLADQVRRAATEGARDELAMLTRQQDVLSAVYLRERGLATWPVDATIIRSFVVSQVVPLLSLTKVADAIAARFFRSP